MSEEAIQDILEQTESDPAFQALFDLFDYGKKTISFKAVRRKTFLWFLWKLNQSEATFPRASEKSSYFY